MDAMQPISAVILVLTLLAGALFFLKSRGAASFRLPRRASGASRHLQVVEHVALGPQHSLHLVRVGDRTYVLSTAPSSCQLLCETHAGRDGTAPWAGNPPGA